MALAPHIHPDELPWLGERLQAAYDTLWRKLGYQAGILPAPDDPELFVIFTDDGYGAHVTTRDEAEVAARLESVIGSEALGALDTVKEVGERLVPGDADQHSYSNDLSHEAKGLLPYRPEPELHAEEAEARAAYEAFNAARAAHTNTFSPKWEHLHEEIRGIWRDAAQRHRSWGADPRP